MAEVVASVKASPFRVNPAMYRPPGNAACNWERPETSSCAPELPHALFPTASRSGCEGLVTSYRFSKWALCFAWQTGLRCAIGLAGRHLNIVIVSTS
ncbi:hypothetical protein LCGC14_3030370, partial [marine sediment metagenome]